MIRTDSYSWVVKLLVFVAMSGGAGLAVGWWLDIQPGKNHILRFENSEIDLRESPAIEGEPIDVDAYLHNSGNVPIRITKMVPCCGTRIIVNEDERAVTEIAVGASALIHLRIGTVMGGGEAIKYLRVEGQTADGLDLAPADLVVSIYIMVPLVAFPESSSFILHEEGLSAPVKQTIVLADLWPGKGLSIKSITSTLGDKLRYQLVPAHGEIGIGSRRLQKRHNLELSFMLDPTKTAFDHTVTITPDHPKAKPVEVRLFGRIIPRCGLDAESITFCGKKPGERIVRRIEYHYRDQADQQIRLVKAPTWLSGSVSEGRDGLKVLTLTCTLPQGKGDRVEQACVEFGRDKKCSILPIFVSYQTDSRSE